MKVKAIILAGGEGRRIGCYKPLQILNDRPLFYWAVKPYLELDLKIVISVKDREQRETLEKLIKTLALPLKNLDFIEDAREFKGRGPIAGIFQAMRAFSGDLLIISAVDQPLVKPSLVNELIRYGEIFISLAIICENENHLEPFPGLYPGALLQELEKYVDLTSKHSLRGFLEHLKSRNLLASFRNWNKLDLQGLSFMNINTQRDLEKAKECSFLKET